MPDRTLSSSLLALILSACITTDPAPEPEEPTPSPEMGSESMEMETERDIEFAPPPDMPAPAEEMDAPIVQDFPTRVTTLGASFDGVLRPRQSIEVTLTASSNDRVTLWLRKQPGSAWNPSVEIFKPGETETWVYGNPRGNDDASIPFRSSQLDEGWRFDDAGEYRMVIANLSDAEAPFRFTLECKSGPCAVDENDRDGDGVANTQDNCPMLPNPGQADTDGDGAGDLCDEDSGVDAYEGLSDQALKDAIVANHRHVSFSYDDARDQLFETVDNQDGLVECVYTGTRIRTTVRPPGDQLNTEHTWPQSRGADVLPARSDLHHLFPTTPGSNTRRSNNYFGEVTSVDWEEGGSELGRNAEGEKRFEPRPSHRGNVARALFYFSVIYGYSIEDFEEQTLRQWHLDDPVDARERERNQRVADVQVSRNPFIDFPQIVERISDF